MLTKRIRSTLTASLRYVSRVMTWTFVDSSRRRVMQTYLAYFYVWIWNLDNTEVTCIEIQWALAEQLMEYTKCFALSICPRWLAYLHKTRTRCWFIADTKCIAKRNNSLRHKLNSPKQTGLWLTNSQAGASFETNGIGFLKALNLLIVFRWNVNPCEMTQVAFPCWEARRNGEIEPRNCTRYCYSIQHNRSPSRR